MLSHAYRRPEFGPFPGEESGFYADENGRWIILIASKDEKKTLWMNGNSYGAFSFIFRPHLTTHEWLVEVRRENESIFLYGNDISDKVEEFISSNIFIEQVKIWNNQNILFVYQDKFDRGNKIYWKGEHFGPFEQVISMDTPGGELMFAAYDEDGYIAVYHKGRKLQAFKDYGDIQISEYKASYMYKKFGDINTDIYINGGKAGNGFLYSSEKPE